MYYKIPTLLFLQFATIYTAPLHLQLLHPIHQKSPVQSQQMLQQQLLELQRLEGLQQINSLSTLNPFQMKAPPVLILIPNSQTAKPKSDEQTNHDVSKTKEYKEIVDEDLDSVIIEADSDESETKPQRAVYLVPNYARISIGDVISAIPFLPIEINVPDTIVWAYNGISSGISSIISIIGQRLPFTPSSVQDPNQEVRLKSVLQQLQMKKRTTFAPIIIMPIAPQMIPIQIPIHV